MRTAFYVKSMKWPPDWTKVLLGRLLLGGEVQP
jgi:hypothetical protein